MILRLLKRLKTEWRQVITTEETREHIQFFSICVILGVVSLFMSVMNYFTGWKLLMWQTIFFFVANVINAILIFFGGTLEKIAKWLFGIETVALFSMFLIVGEPQGFSALWIPLLPACGILLFKWKHGTMISLAQFLIVIFLLWTPVGNSLLQYEYTESFMMRFPVLYVAFYGVGMFFELLRQVTQTELQKARDKFKLLYVTEGDRANAEEQKNIEMVQVLSSEYEAVYYANLDTKKIIAYAGDGENSKNGFDSYFKNKEDYEEAYRAFVDAKVVTADKERMIESASKDKVLEELSKQATYSLIFGLISEEKELFYEMKFIRVANDNGGVSSVMVAFSDKDYSVRKDKEQQMELESALVKAEAANEAKSKFLFNMSHDIRTPMNAIIGFTDMAKKYENDEEKVNDCLDKVKLSSTNLLSLINDILDMSRIENNKVEIELKKTDLKELVEDSTIVISERAKEKNIQTETRFQNVVHNFVFLDKVQTNRILMNIMSNAIKYTPRGGKATLTISEEPGKMGNIGIYKFVFEDNGIGMSDEFVKTIFEPFSREKSATVSGIQGTGLGMSITKRLVGLMNGDIQIETKLGAGTKVIVTLPLAIADDEKEEKIVNTIDSNDYSFEGKKVLLVEDNELNMEIAVDLLEDVGFTVSTSSDGDEAVALLEKEGPEAFDIVLMDIQMPKMNGYDATVQIRKLEGFDKLPIIALTANAFEEDRKKALRYGMNGHLAKPIEIDKLKALLHGFL